MLNFTEDIARAHGGDAALFLAAESAEPGMLKPVLSFSEQSLKNAAISDNYWYGTVLHLYQHLRQLAEGRAPPEFFILYPRGTTFGREATRLFFSLEIEASSMECGFALGVGNWRETSVCTSYKEGGVRAMYRKIAEKSRFLGTFCSG